MAVAEGLSTGEKYDVFLSFRGPDTRESFADCLFEFLKEAGLRVFMDDEELRVGESIGREIQKAIYDSKLFVPIFSSRFGSSKWCLKEIAWMADCMEEFPGKKEMLPIFYDVDASNVKLKTDLYAKALLEHKKTSGHETVERWRKALIKVPEVKGWNRTDAKGQGKLIRRIAQDISHRLELKHRILPDHFIGIEEQVQHIMNALDCGSRDVRLVVIHGMGGIGKTTLASVVFNKINWQFQECSFLSNVRESSPGNSIVNLQNKFLHDIRRFSPCNFCDANDAMNCIQGSSQNKDVLVVLDDVSDMDQIRNLIGMGDWVGMGSRVIITTRNLSCIANVEEIENNVEILQGKKIYIHRMRDLGFDSSLQLLCWHAFGKDSPPHGYEQLSHDVLSFTGGVPLALKVIGSYLRRKSVAIWKEMLKKLKKVPHDRLYREILMSSYEMLCDGTKEIFLDTTFFLAYHDKTMASYYWDARGLFPETSIDTLISYALVKIVSPNELWMHDIIRDLGREVVRKESNGNLGRRSRLCNEDAKRLLLKGQGTKYVRALKLGSTHAHNFTPAQLSGLTDLQFLELCGGNFIGEFGDNCLSELVWLSWQDCPLNFRWTNLNFENLVVLRLSKSKITDTWSGWEQLKTAISLKVMQIEGCELLGNLTDSIGDLEFLCELHLSSTGITELPESIGKLRNLTKLNVSFNQLRGLPATIGALDRLEVLDACHNRDLQGEIPSEFGRLMSLEYLNLSWTGIRGLPSSMHQLSRLKSLSLEYCNQIQELPDLPTGLNSLSLNHSTSVSSWERLSNLEGLSRLSLSKSSETEIQIDGLKSLKNLTLLEIRRCAFLERMHDISRLQKLQNLAFLNCPKLVEIEGLTQPLESLQHLFLGRCNSIRCLPDRSGTESPRKLCLTVRRCSKLRDFLGRYDSYSQEREEANEMK